MLSNWLCLAFALLEVFFYSGVAYGFGFMQYIFEKEQVFWDAVCYDPEKHPNCYLPTSMNRVKNLRPEKNTILKHEIFLTNLYH